MATDSNNPRDVAQWALNLSRELQYRDALPYMDPPLALGDLPGHPFRGNQYTDGGGGGGDEGGKLAIARAEVEPTGDHDDPETKAAVQRVRDFLANDITPGTSFIEVGMEKTYKVGGRDGLLVKSRSDGTPTADKYPQGVVRRNRGNVMVSNKYEQNVNQQRLREEKEADFRAEGLHGGASKHDEDDVEIVTNKNTGNTMLQVRPQTDKEGNIIPWKDTSFYDKATGRELTAEEVKDLRENYLPKKKEGGNAKQELKKEVPSWTISIHNIYSLKGNKGYKFISKKAIEDHPPGMLLSLTLSRLSIMSPRARGWMLFLTDGAYIDDTQGAWVLGDLPGHPFRGNQYSDGEGGGGGEDRGKAAIARAETGKKVSSPAHAVGAASMASAAAREGGENPKLHKAAAEVHRQAAEATEAAGRGLEAREHRQKAALHDSEVKRWEDRVGPAADSGAAKRAAKQGIVHANSSGQGYHPEHADNPHHRTLFSANYRYSHSTVIGKSDGSSYVSHTYKHRDDKDQAVSVDAKTGKWSVGRVGGARHLTGGDPAALAKIVERRNKKIGKRAPTDREGDVARDTRWAPPDREVTEDEHVARRNRNR